MRALLVVNPKATTTTERSRDVLVRALRSALDLHVEYTQRRGHATTLAREAAESGADLVVTLGGDGTVNEAVNGLMTARTMGTDPPGPPAYRLPALAVVPGGSTNVFARSLGLPKDWAEGTSVILDGLRDGRFRTIGLGRADDRYFTFCAGIGWDAATINRVEQARLRGRVSSPSLYVRSMISQFFASPGRRDPMMSVERPGERAESDLAFVIVQNTTPWTYLGDRPVSPNPEASFDLGLDLMAFRQLRIPSTVRTLSQLYLRSSRPHGSGLLHLHDQSDLSVIAGEPHPYQLDGEYLGLRQKVRFTAVFDALRVIC